MKKKLLLIQAFTLIFISVTYAQYDCGNGRYRDSIFGVTVTSNVLYGNNINYQGTSTDLYMDIYEPAGDTAAARPMIIFAPKGTFIQCNKTELTMVELCTRFASKGYVTAAINYRVGVNYVTMMTDPQGEFSRAVLRAVHDYKAAIRFFRKDAATDNNYRVDTGLVIAGGSSAGAITAIHLTYLDKESEVPSYIDTASLGGMEGMSGNPGYTSNVHYVVNLCGAIDDSSWIEPADIPIVSMHGNLDTEVPYGTGSPMGITALTVDGSASIYQRAMNAGVDNDFYTFWGQQHIPYDENAGGQYMLYMDTVENYVTQFLYDRI